MSPLMDVALLLIDTLVGFYLLIVILRFLLQLVKADFYNPLSQFIVKATNPPLLPLRRIIPGWGGIDVASIILAMLIQTAVITLLLTMVGAPFDVIQLLSWAFIGLLSLILNVFKWGLLIVVIASWLAPNSYNPSLILINQILEPLIRPVRSRMPDMGGMDFSPIVLILSFEIINRLIIIPLAVQTELPAKYVFGI